MSASDDKAVGVRADAGVFSDARSGHPTTAKGRALLRVVAVVQIVLAIVLAPLAAVWYGLHEMPGWLRESIRPAGKTLRYGKVGPHRGIVW